MITLFTTTKDFTGINRTNQLNAIRSWLSALIHPEVIIFGRSNGIEEIGEHPNLKIVNQVRTSSSGVPYANEMFDVISKIAKYPLCCYVNADILLTDKFFGTSLFIHEKTNKNYLIVGERIDVNVNEILTFDDNWEKSFINKYQSYFKNHPPYGSDFFVFPKEQYNYDNMPELLIGRLAWDNVMIYNARKRKFKTIDISYTVKVFHQNHAAAYSLDTYHPDNTINFRHLPDKNDFTLTACNYIFVSNRLVKDKARGDKREYEQIELSLGNIFLSYYIKFYFKRMSTVIKRGLKLILSSFNSKPKRKPGNYISCDETVAAAKSKGISVGEYVEELWDQRGGSSKVIEQLDSMGVFEKCRDIVEIGGGTGRYIDKVIHRYPVKKIYSYETAGDWSYYLEETYSPVLVRRVADGKSLCFEDDNSVDAVFAHGVFVYLPFLHCFEYFKDMIRATKQGGFIAFDVYLKDAFGFQDINNWLSKPERYPVVMDQSIIESFFKMSGCSFTGKFNNKHGHSFSTYLVFQKNENVTVSINNNTNIQQGRNN